MRFFALALLVLAFSYCEPIEYDDSRGEKYLVVGISDGDSLTILDKNNKRERVRLATIDAPENGQAFGKPAKASLSQMIYKRYVQVVGAKRDQYGRIIGEVYIGELNANVEQLRRGYAWHYKRHANQQTRSQAKEYSDVENAARMRKAGLWRDKNPTPPWEYRKRNRR